MDRNALQEKIRELLKTSTIPDEKKKEVSGFLIMMSITSLQRIFNILKREHDKMAKLDKKEERIKLKYEVMVEKLSKMQLKK